MIYRLAHLETWSCTNFWTMYLLSIWSFYAKLLIVSQIRQGQKYDFLSNAWLTCECVNGEVMQVVPDSLVLLLDGSNAFSQRTSVAIINNKLLS